MARHRKVSVVIWTDIKFVSLSDDAKLLFLYLLTHPHQTSLGAMQATMGGLADERGWLPERLSKAFAEVTRKGMANYDPRARCLWLPNFLKYNGPESPNVVKAWFGALDLIPECSLKSSAIQRAKAILEDYDETFREAFDKAFAKAFPKGLRITDEVPSPNPEQEQEPYPEQDSDTSSHSENNQRQDSNAAAPAVESEHSTSNGSKSGRARKPSSESVLAVFDHWRTVHSHPLAKLDDKRRKLIGRALEGYSEADLCQAISGYKNSPHHMGQNERATVYDDIELLLRDAKHIDAGLKFYAEPPRTDLSAQTRRIIDQTEDWEPPEVRHGAK